MCSGKTGSATESAISGTSAVRKKVSWQRVLFILSCFILPTINFLIFYVYLNFSSILMAFQQKQGGNIVWTLENFRMFFAEFQKESSTIRIAFRNTSISFLITEVMFGIGFLVSYFLYKKILGYKIFRTLFFLPGLMAGTIVSSFFIKLVSYEGPIAPIVQKLFSLEDLPMLLSDSRYANYTIFANMVWLSFPGNMILWGGTFSRIPDSVIESAKIDGVNWIQETFRIIIPIVWSTFSTLLILSFVGFFGASGQVFLLTKGELGTMTVSCWMYLQVYNNTGNVDASNVYNYMSAIGILMTLCTAVIVVISRSITNRFFGDVQY